MPKIRSYGTVTPYNSDFIIGTDRDISNVTRNYKVSKIVDIILASLGIGTVTSIATTSGTFVSVTGGTITTAGTITMDISATGTPGTTTFLRGDGTWSEPGPAPTQVAAEYNNTSITTDIDSLNFTGAGVSGTASDQDVLIIIPGDGSVVDSVIAGTGISVSGPTGNVTITNTGVTQARAGGNVTLSGGTGAVTLSTTANAGTVTTVNPGLGIDTIANNTTNPNVDVEYTGTNNIVDISESIVTASGDDFVEFNQLTSSNIKSARLRDINEDMLTLVKQTIDDADLNKVKNTEPSGFTTTAEANNMVTLTITEYQAIAVKDPNTLYLIIGAGTSFTVNPSIVDAITGGTLGVDYTISTSPTSFTGINGTSYTFTTTVNPGSGTFTGTNPVVTTDNVVNSSGNPYNRSITVSGTWTAPASPTGQARLNISLQADTSGTGNSIASGGNPSIWDYKSANSQPLDLNPIPAQSSGPYTFNAEIEIKDTDYQFVSSPEYQLANGSFQTGATTFSDGLTFNNGITDVTQIIRASYALKQFVYTLNQVDNIVDSSGVTGGGAGVEYSLNFTGTTAGTYNINTPITGTWTATASSGFQFVGGTSSASVSITPFSITSDTTETLTLTGTMESTAPQQNEVTFNLTDNITYTGSSSSNRTITPAQSASSGLLDVNLYYTIPGSTGSPNYQPIATAASGYQFTAGPTFTNTNSNAIYDQMPAPPAATSDWTVTGTLVRISATITQSQITPASNITYNTFYFAQGGGSSTNASTSGANSSAVTLNPAGPLTIGNGTVNATVSKTAPNGQAVDPVSITWNKNGVLQNTANFSAGNYVYSSYTYTGVVNGDVLQTIIYEQ